MKVGKFVHALKWGLATAESKTMGSRSGENDLEKELSKFVGGLELYDFPTRFEKLLE